MSFIGILIVAIVVFLGFEIAAEIMRVFNSKIMREIDNAIARYDRERNRQEFIRKVNETISYLNHITGKDVKDNDVQDN